jgi:hypothetical protein
MHFSHMMSTLQDVRCDERVEKSFISCEHKAVMACSEDPSSHKCKARCNLPLECCGKMCSSPCWDCQRSNGTSEATTPVSRVKHTRHPCKKSLYCGHQCQEACDVNHTCTTICKKECRQKCAHAQCSSYCSTPCAPCQQKCNWKCPHYACPVPCGSVCFMKPIFFGHHANLPTDLHSTPLRSALRQRLGMRSSMSIRWEL